MQLLIDLANNVLDLNEEQIFNEVFNLPQVKDFIISLNTQSQLFEQGVDGEGRLLSDIGGDYSDLTIEGVPGLFEGKARKGLPTNWVTLFDSGEFYLSFEVKVDGKGFTISADTIKDDGSDLQDRWGNAILGLNRESLIELVEFVTPFYIEVVRKKIQC